MLKWEYGQHHFFRFWRGNGAKVPPGHGDDHQDDRRRKPDRSLPPVRPNFRLNFLLNSRRAAAHLGGRLLALLSVPLRSRSRRFLQVFDGQHQSIATPSQSLDVPGGVRRIPQGTAKGLYCRLDSLVEVVDRMIHPQRALDFLAGDDPALTFYEHPQDLKYLFSEEDLGARTGMVGTGIARIARLSRSQFASAQVELKGSEPNS